MATITITVPARDARSYVEEVLRQIDAGFTSGHVDHETHWDSAFEHGEDDCFV